MDEVEGPRQVSTWDEADLAVSLGASREQAAAVVDVLRQQGLLAHGIAVVAAAAASRWGIPMGEALIAIADGRVLRGTFSDYELRVGREEAEDDLATLIDDGLDITHRDQWEAMGLPHEAVPASRHHLAAEDLG